MCTCKDCVHYRLDPDGISLCSDSISVDGLEPVDPDSSCGFFLEESDFNRKLIHDLRLKYSGLHELFK